MSGLYFAFGSNMSLAQMRTRCPSGERMAIACLAGHRLVFPRYSTRRTCGVASIAPDPHESVWGVIFRLSDADFAALDRFEGFYPARPAAGNRYVRQTVTVQRDGDTLQPVDCRTYIAVPEPGLFRPSKDYLETIITGAVENGLPEDYIVGLRRIETES